MQKNAKSKMQKCRRKRGVVSLMAHSNPENLPPVLLRVPLYPQTIVPRATIVPRFEIVNSNLWLVMESEAGP